MPRHRLNPSGLKSRTKNFNLLVRFYFQLSSHQQKRPAYLGISPDRPNVSGWRRSSAVAMDSRQLIQELVQSFDALADQVQDLTDRKTILEHKLRYAHEQVCNYSLFTSQAVPHTIMMNISSRSALNRPFWGVFLETSFTTV